MRQLCPRRKVPCQLGCGKHVEIEARDKHEAGACANRIVACARGCGRSLRAALAPAHEEKCSGSAPLCSISSLKCAVVFGDEAAKDWAAEVPSRRETLGPRAQGGVGCTTPLLHQQLQFANFNINLVSESILVSEQFPRQRQSLLK